MIDITGAIFDMDGTLVDSLMLWDVLWKRYGEKHLDGKEFRPDDETNKAIRTMILSDVAEYLHERFDLGPNSADLLQTANELMAEFYGTAVELKPGVREFLDHCKAKGIPMCLATATAPELLNLALDHCDLRKYFVKILSCAEIGKGKEEPDIFLAALDVLGTEKETTWLFEDSLTSVRTASKIGLPTVGIYDQYTFDHDLLKQTATVYLDKGQTMADLI